MALAALFMGLVTLAYVSCVAGMQLKNKLRVIKRDMAKMEDDVRSKRLFCVACGDVDKVTKPSNRRNIESTSSRHVFPLWKSLLMNELQKSDCCIDVDELLQKQNLVMCKKCFYAYEKYFESLEVIPPE